MHDAKCRKNLQALKSVFDQRASLECVFVLNILIRIIFHFIDVFINILIFSNHKSIFKVQSKVFDL